MLMNRLKLMGGGVGAGGLCATGHGGGEKRCSRKL